MNRNAQCVIRLYEIIRTSAIENWYLTAKTIVDRINPSARKNVFVSCYFRNKTDVEEKTTRPIIIVSTVSCAKMSSMKRICRLCQWYKYGPLETDSSPCHRMPNERVDCELHTNRSTHAIWRAIMPCAVHQPENCYIVNTVTSTPCTTYSRCNTPTLHDVCDNIIQQRICRRRYSTVLLSSGTAVGRRRRRRIRLYEKDEETQLTSRANFRKSSSVRNKN